MFQFVFGWQACMVDFTGLFATRDFAKRVFFYPAVHYTVFPQYILKCIILLSKSLLIKIKDPVSE
jgi:hypothetical protein